MLQLTIKNLRWIVSSRTQGRCAKHAKMLKQWSTLGFLPAGSEAICIAGARGGLEPHKVGSTKSYWNGF